MTTPQTTSSQTSKDRFTTLDFDIAESNDSDGVPNSYIVMLKGGSDLKAHLEWLNSTANSMGSERIKIRYEYKREFV
ncbi:hypothetical protein FRC12_002913 [Ceratobasidium sp. 428]|nr:hypothetical protein FRC12_002913 [Ceratobasidium sp. 428]